MFPGGEERFHKHQPHLRENGKPQMNLNNIGILAAKCAQSDLGTEQGSPTDAFLGVWVVLSRDAAQSVSSETAFCLFTASSDILEVNTPAVARHGIVSRWEGGRLLAARMWEPRLYSRKGSA